MVRESELQNLLPWLIGGAGDLAWVVAVLTGVALFFSYLVAAIRHGPLAGFSVIWQVMATAANDALGTSPRRIMALAWLSFKESIGQRLLVALGLFLLILLFAGWFLSPDSPNPGRLYLSFVLNATTYLVLVLALFLSSFSLPGDIKTRTIYTIVTKPVRCGEIVLGRILGFAAICTLLLATTGLLSYVFVVRSINHTHEIAQSDLSEAGNSGRKQGRTTNVQNHRHIVTVDAAKGADGDAAGSMDIQHGHWHEVTKASSGYALGQPLGTLAARVPMYGKLSFADRQGQQADRGISVGKEWTYRSYIAGSTLATANWRFEGINEQRFAGADGRTSVLPIALNISVFRTHKGKIERGIVGSITLRNPQTQLTSRITTFRSKEFVLHEIDLPRRQVDADESDRPIDIFRDLVSDDGQIEIIIRCVEEGQYFGMAQADVYLRSSDASFTVNFIKGYLGIWLQMVIVVGLGVMFSTLLSAPVTMMATSASITMGMFSSYIFTLAQGPKYGGGPIESLVRIVTQRNMTSALEPGRTTTLVEMIDKAYLFALWLVIKLLPDFSEFSDINFIAEGFDVPAGLLLQHFISAVVYLGVVCIVGYFFLKTREVAR